jgi:monomeric isocitrate dehydrogenase
MLGDTLMNAVGKWLENNRSPGRKVKQIDNRYYIAFFFSSPVLKLHA